MNQPGKVANSARGQLNRENGDDVVSIPVRAWKFGLARRVRPSRPGSVSLFSTLRRLYLVLIITYYGIPPAFFRDDVHLLCRQPPSVQSRVVDGVITQFCVPTAFFTAESPPAQGQQFSSAGTFNMPTSYQ